MECALRSAPDTSLTRGHRVAFARLRRTNPSVASKPWRRARGAQRCADIYRRGNATDRSRLPPSASARRAAPRRTSRTTAACHWRSLQPPKHESRRRSAPNPSSALVLRLQPEKPDDRFAPHGRAKLFGALAIHPWRGEASSGLSIRDEHFRHFANAFHVQRTGGATSGVGNDATVWIDLTHLVVPQLPEIKQKLLPPENVGAPRRVLRIACAWQI